MEFSLALSPSKPPHGPVTDPEFPRGGANPAGGGGCYNLLFGKVFPKHCMESKK